MRRQAPSGGVAASSSSSATKPNDFDESGWPDEGGKEYDAQGLANDDVYDPSTGKPKKRIVKTVTAAIVLFTVGSIMIWLGTKNLYVDRERAIAMLVLGSLMFIPGSYASFILFGAWRRWAGYRYEDLPSYDD